MHLLPKDRLQLLLIPLGQTIIPKTPRKVSND